MTPAQANDRIISSRTRLIAWQDEMPDNTNGHTAARIEAEIAALRGIVLEFPHKGEALGRLILDWRYLLQTLREQSPKA